MLTVLCADALQREIFALPVSSSSSSFHRHRLWAESQMLRYRSTTYVSDDISWVRVKSSTSTTSHTCLVYAVCLRLGEGVSTGRFIMFSVITFITITILHIHRKTEKVSFDNEICSSFSHTRVNMGQHGHYIHSHRQAAEMWTTVKNNLRGGGGAEIELFRLSVQVS
jgi:hypothetical protein